MQTLLSPREREKLILRHQVTALSTVKKHAPRGVPTEDLRQEAMVALVLAVDTFDPAKGEITTHIYWVVRGAITALGRREHRHAQPITPAMEVVDGRNRHVRNHMLRLNDQVDDGTRMDRLEAAEPSPEEIAAHREMMAAAELLKKPPKKKSKRSQRRVVAAGKKIRVDAVVLAVARAM